MEPEVIAHRGASAYLAEHTLAAYELALEQGADGLECDVRLTRDGHLVCVHDRTVNRTSSGTGAVSGMTLAELDQLDFQSWHGDEPRRGVLTLETLLGLVVDTGTRLFVETKHPVRYGGLVEAKLVAALTRHGLAAPESKDASRVVVMSFSEQAIRRVRRFAPRLPTVMLIGAVHTPRLIQAGDFAGPGIRRLRDDPGYVARCAEQGRQVYCWTVDEPEDVLLCRELGVRFVATNKPADTRKALHGSVPTTEPTG